MAIFYIREAIEEIVEIKRDKAKLMDIKLKTEFVNFESSYLVKTDQKRIQ